MTAHAGLGDTAGAVRIRPPHAAVIFDMDGVVTDTASLHAQAWKQLFDETLQDERATAMAAQSTFDPVADYHRYVDGRSREDGVRAFLASRGLDVPEGKETDDAEAWSVAGLAARKNVILHDLLEHGVHVFPAPRTCCVGSGTAACRPDW